MRNLKKLRRDAAMTQYALSRATGVSRAKISNVELGILKLTPGEAERIRKVLIAAARKKSAHVLTALGDTLPDYTPER